MRNRHGLVLLAVVSLVLTSRAAATEATLSPSQQAYQDVSVAREKYSDVIAGAQPATPEQLQRIIKELQASLILLDQPHVHDMAEGNLYLRYRRFNILADLIKLHARTGEKAQALQDWRDLMTMDWAAEPSSYLLDDPNVRRLMDDPAFADIAAQYHAAHWWSTGASLKTPYRPTLPVAERIAGLSRVWSIARDGFVWFDHVPDLDWDQAYLETLPKVIATERTDDYYRVLTAFVARLHDGHSGVFPPEALETQVYSRPGFRTRLIGNRVIVVRVDDQALLKAGVALGDELMQVDGTPVRDYADRNVLPYVSSSTSQDRDVREFTYGLLRGSADTPVTLMLRDAQGRSREVQAARSGYAKVEQTNNPLFRVRDDGIAVLAVNELEDDAALKALQQNLDALVKARGLVLDLRGNGGGSTRYGTAILNYLSTAPLPEMVSRYRENPALDLATSDKPSIRWRTSEPGHAMPKPAQLFSGPVVMLIDAQTFSAGEDTAATFKWMKRGRIIGMPSGGSTGQPYLFALPGGGSARICVKRDSYPDGTDFVGVGVLPDVRMDTTIDAIRSGTDPVLTAAIASLQTGAVSSR